MAPSKGLTAREQIGLVALAVARARRGALARMRRSRLLRWRYRSPVADELSLAPPDLRAHDPSFADEVAADNFGLAGAVANLRGRVAIRSVHIDAKRPSRQESREERKYLS